MVGVQKVAQKRRKEIVMYTNKDIVLAVDYHDEKLMIRSFNCHTGEERVLRRPTRLALAGPPGSPRA